MVYDPDVYRDWWLLMIPMYTGTDGYTVNNSLLKTFYFKSTK